LNVLIAEDERLLLLILFLRRMGDFDVFWDFEVIKKVLFSYDESLDYLECLDYLESRFGFLSSSPTVTQETSRES
jgi:hypothetical protein